MEIVKVGLASMLFDDCTCEDMDGKENTRGLVTMNVETLSLGLSLGGWRGEFPPH